MRTINHSNTDIKSFETDVDNYVKGLVSEMSPLGLLTLISSNSYFCDHYINSTSNDRKSRGYHIHNIGYLSHIITWAKKENFEGTEIYLQDTDPQINADLFKKLCSYAEFCQIFPNIHRKFYHSTIINKALTLKHKSVNQSHLEALDMILSTLYNPEVGHIANFEKNWFKCAIEDISNNSPTDNAIPVLKLLFKKYQQHNWYLSPIDSKTLYKISGATLEEFHSFSSACYSICQFYLLAADAALEESEHNPENETLLMQTVFNLIFPFFKKEELINLISHISEISPKKILSLMRYFSTSLEDYKKYGEGYTPPFIEKEAKYLFNPIIVQRNISPRNILFHVQKNNPKLYDDVISSELESTLVSHAEFYLNNLSNIIIKKFHKWENGEIDILIYKESENTVIFMEAKAFLPPDSTRSVTRASERIIDEAIEKQIKRFNSLTQSQKDDILSSALNRSVKNTKVIYSILTWSSLGDHSAWEKYGDITPINIPMLAIICKVHSDSLLEKFPNHAKNLINEILEKAQPKWEAVTQTLGPYEFTCPTLKYNEAGIANFRKLWRPTKDAF